ncbi:MAG: hypothetical protein FJW26_13090 [Acidimicrobiia bacterium]|nr:hypothetical protein [Acidimicrobiia bacterium]
MSRGVRFSRLGGTLGALTVGFFLISHNCQMQAQKSGEPLKPPEAISVFPVGAQQGSVFEALVRGRNLEGVYGVWFATEGVAASVEKVEQIEVDSEPDPYEKRWGQKLVQSHLVILKIQVAADATRGKHSFRLVTPNGMSNPLTFLVDAGPVTPEIATDHSKAQDAQHLELPAVVNGKVSEMGERDFYSFDAAAGQQLTFHALSNTTLRDRDAAQFALYRPGGSWYDPNRPLRLAWAPQARLTYTFEKPGRYLVAVTSFQGVGGPDYSYRLCIGQAGSLHFSREEELLTPPTRVDKLQSPFRRKLEPDRLQALQARTVGETLMGHSGAGGRSTAVTGSAALSDPSSSASDVDVTTDDGVLRVLTEVEPNDTPDQASEVSLPFLVEGAIGRPNDVDTFKFKVPAKAKLAFELETPEVATPAFNPHLSVIDANGEEMLTNYYRKIAGDGDDWVKLIQAKVVYTFEREGYYTLRIRDITARFGETAFRYRVIVRPQIPHVGKIEVQEDGLNLVAGEAKKLTLVTEQEEGFGGEILFSVQGLPPGVQALAGADVEPDTEPPLPEINKERFVPKSKKTTILLAADADAPASGVPQLARIIARPVVGGKIGAPLTVGGVVVMVLKPDPESAVRVASSGRQE